VVADAHPTVVTELPNDGYKAATAPDGRRDHVVTLAALPEGGLLLQVGVSTTASDQAGAEYARLISVVLPREAGGLIERTTGGGEVAGTLGARPVFSVSEPSPAVTWARSR
jgi:hypothetical protein